MSLERSWSVSSKEIKLTRSSKGAKRVSDSTLKDFIDSLSQTVPFHTGWIPNNYALKSFSQAGDRAQAVLECPPGVNLTTWGAYERDKNAKIYELAQPWRYVITDFQKGSLLGARMFYSPIQMSTPDKPLYHINLPNVNCRGYGRDNGVGWICLYHHANQSNPSMSWSDRLSNVAHRCSGSEAYNDANMSGTDGARFYKSHKKPSYLWDPDHWDAKSEKEGFEWTLDPELWIPVKVKDMHTQGKHHPNGIVLTLAMAMEGGYANYYSDTSDVKLVQKHRQGKMTKADWSSLFNMIAAHAETKTAKRLKSAGASMGQFLKTVTVSATEKQCRACAQNKKLEEYSRKTNVRCDTCIQAGNKIKIKA